jgi:hypothetical protein
VPKFVEFLKSPHSLIQVSTMNLSRSVLSK